MWRCREADTELELCNRSFPILCIVCRWGLLQGRVCCRRIFSCSRFGYSPPSIATVARIDRTPVHLHKPFPNQDTERTWFLDDLNPHTGTQRNHDLSGFGPSSRGATVARARGTAGYPSPGGDGKAETWGCAEISISLCECEGRKFMGRGGDDVKTSVRRVPS